MCVQSTLFNWTTMIFPFILPVNIPGGEIVSTVLHTQMSWGKGVWINLAFFFFLFSPAPSERSKLTLI